MTQLTRSANESVLLDPPSVDLALAAPAVRPARHVRVSDLAQLAKPRITAMVVITAFIGFQMGRGSPLALPLAAPWLTLLGMVLGTALSCMGASALNQVLERDTDRLMERTSNRPLPAGRVSVGLALLLGLALSLLGVALLAALANPLAAALSAITIASYVLIYTPLKRHSSLCTIVGAVPGALPPVIGFAAATGSLAAPAWVMFAILFLWQLPHFLAIAWLYRDQYARAGLPMLPVVDDDYRATCRQILLSCLALLPLGLLPTVMGMSGLVYFAGALLAGLAFLAFGVALIVRRTRAAARALFFVSLLYLPLVFSLMLIDRV